MPGTIEHTSGHAPRRDRRARSGASSARTVGSSPCTGGSSARTIFLLAAGLSACASVPPGSPATDDPCTVVPVPAAASDVVGLAGTTGTVQAGAESPVVIGLSEPVDTGRAPVPRTEAERLVFGHLYETLVTVTCRDGVEPGIAASWRSEDEGRRWTFALRPDVFDWEGVAVTGAHVAESWSAARAAGLGDPSTDPTARIASMSVRDPHTLRVDMVEPVTAAFFAHPSLAVRTTGSGAATPSGTPSAELSPGQTWAGGTGPYRPAPGPDRRPGASPSLVLAPWVPETSNRIRAAPTSRPWLELRTVRGDPRNALERGLDLLVTGDPAVVEYAAAAPGFQAVPLAWDRSYLLIVYRSGGPIPASEERPTLLHEVPAGALEALARDALGGEARPARSLAREFGACATFGAEPADGPAAGRPSFVSDGMGGAAARTDRIAYEAGDPIARTLAERLLALALGADRTDGRWLTELIPGAARGGFIRTAGLSSAELARAVRAGRDLAYVISIRRGSSAACDAVRAVLAPRPLGPDTTATRPEDALSGTVAPLIVPLVDTRRTLIVRRGVGGIELDGTGALRLDQIRRAAGATP